MGQYHVVYNLDKKEYFSLAGAKLWEKAYSPLHSMALNVLLSNSNGRGGGDLYNPILKDKKKGKTVYERWSNKGQGLIKHTKREFDAVNKALAEVSGRWAGDRILIQGDYAEKTDPSFQPRARLDLFTDITAKVAEAFELIMKLAEQGDDELIETLTLEKEFRGIK